MTKYMFNRKRIIARLIVIKIDKAAKFIREKFNTAYNSCILIRIILSPFVLAWRLFLSCVFVLFVIAIAISSLFWCLKTGNSIDDF